MTESEVKKCPKCRRIMMPGILSTKEKVSLETDLRRRLIRLYVGGWALRKGIFYGDTIIPFCCKNCGYIELYKEIEKSGSQRSVEKA